MNAQELATSLELKKGDYFTIRRWLSHQDYSWVGTCFEAKVVDYPLVRALTHDGIGKGEVLTLNLERVEIMPLSPEFVESVMAEAQEAS